MVSWDMQQLHHQYKKSQEQEEREVRICEMTLLCEFSQIRLQNHTNIQIMINSSTTHHALKYHSSQFQNIVDDQFGDCLSMDGLKFDDDKQQQNSMSTEQIYKGTERHASLEREYSAERADKFKFKITKRIGQLENKACFFEGQLNPVIIENKALKEKLVELNRSVSASSDLLRNLLPVEGNPTRKLKLQIANIEEISGMIKEDWLEMKGEIKTMKQKIEEQSEVIGSMEGKMAKIISDYEDTLRKYKIRYETQIEYLIKSKQVLEENLEELTRKSKEEREEIIKSYSQRLQEADLLKKEFHRYMQEMKEKCANYERVTQRLREEIAHNLQEFEKSKENIKLIYEQLMQSKLDQQSKEFEFLLKAKEDEKIKLMEEMNEQAEELRRKISEKNSQINHLSGINDKLKQEIGAAKDEIWQQKLEIDKCHKQIKEISRQLHLEEESTRSLKLKIQEREDKISEIEANMRRSRDQYQEELKQERAKINRLEDKILEEQRAMQKKMQEIEAKDTDYKRRLKEKDEKYHQMLQEEKNRYNMLMESNTEGEKRLRGMIEQSERKVREKDNLITSMREGHLRDIKRMEETHEQKLKNILHTYEDKIKLINIENEETIKKIKKDFQIIMNEKELRNNEHIRQLQSEHNSRIYEMDKKYRELEEKSQKKIREIQQSLNGALNDNKKLQESYQEIQQKMRKAEEEHRQCLENHRKESERILSLEKEKLLREMRQQVELLKKEMNEKEQSYKQQLSQMHEQMQKEINLLKRSNAMEVVEEKYNSIIAQLKLELEEQAKRLTEEYSREMNLRSEEYSREMTLRSEEYNRELARLTLEYNKQLGMISKKLEFDISMLNEQLLQEKDLHQFDKMTREEKIKYLVDKISGFKKEMADKDTKILDLYFEVEKKNKELNKIDEIVAERLKKARQQLMEELQEAKADFEQRTGIIKSECQAKVKKVQTERISFTQLIYLEFQTMKDNYGEEMRRLKIKYDELERIFQERPSRAEDLSKIKELIDEKSKLDLEMKECKKKVKEANEIVKYLNLELENYKDTYDIFGSGEQPLSPDRRYYTEVESPIKNLLRRDSSNSSETSDFVSSGLKDKKFPSQASEIQELRLFPPLGRGQAVVEEDNESETSLLRSKNSKRRVEKLLSLKSQHQDKSEQLKNNASLFLGLINKQQKLPVQLKNTNQGYVRRMNRKRTIGASVQKKLKIKQKTLAYDP